jgi:hypothetical protein
LLPVLASRMGCVCCGGREVTAPHRHTMPFRLVGRSRWVKIPAGAGGRGLGLLPRGGRGARNEARGLRGGVRMGAGCP